MVDKLKGGTIGGKLRVEWARGYCEMDLTQDEGVKYLLVTVWKKERQVFSVDLFLSCEHNGRIVYFVLRLDPRKVDPTHWLDKLMWRLLRQWV